MRKSLPILFLGAIAGSWTFLQKYEIRGLDKIQIVPRTTAASTPDKIPASGIADSPENVIRIASFNIQAFGEQKLGKPEIAKTLVYIVSQFDVIAVQEIRAKSQDIIPKFVQMLNAEGARYDYVIGPRLGRSNSKEQYAFIFDSEIVEVDRGSAYTVDDPDDVLHREPFVAGFRTARVDPKEAFTFTLVNVHVDPDLVEMEMYVMDDVFRAVKTDGRNEDDVILLGDFNTDHEHMGELGRIQTLEYAIAGQPTNTRGNKEYDNIIFDRRATAEFTGRSGVYDFASEFNLTPEEALLVSDHFPVWAEFQIVEGRGSGEVAQENSRVRK